MSVQDIECFLPVLSFLTPLADRRLECFRIDGDAPVSPIAFQKKLARENPPCSPLSLPADPAPRLRDRRVRFSTETYRAAADPTTGDTTNKIGGGKTGSASTVTRQRHRDHTPVPFETKGEDKVGPNPPLSSGRRGVAAEDRISAIKEDDRPLMDEEEWGPGGDPLSSSDMTIVSSWRSPPGDNDAPVTPHHGSHEQRPSSHSIEGGAAMICESTTTSPRSLADVKGTRRPKTHGHNTNRGSDTEAHVEISSQGRSDSTPKNDNKTNRLTVGSINDCDRDDGTPVTTDISDHATGSASGTGE